MIVIPAIDLKDGACVRLKQGIMEESTIFSNDPVAMAQRWVDAGARRLHVVDLNGAVVGEPVNVDAVHAIVDAFPDLPVQIGGGIRSEETVKHYLNAGAKYVIIGTQAVKDPLFVKKLCAQFPGRIIVGLDAVDGKVAVEGWLKKTQQSVVKLAKKFENFGVSAIIYTDIGRDGMLKGVNIDSTVELARVVDIPIIASGGITNLEDIQSLCEEQHFGIVGAITGRAIYEGSLDFTVAQRLADQMTGGRDD